MNGISAAEFLAKKENNDDPELVKEFLHTCTFKVSLTNATNTTTFV